MMHHRRWRGDQPIRLGYKRNIVIPTSSDKTIIFPLDCDDGTFKNSHYTPEMTQGLISTQEIVDFLQGIEIFTKPIFGSGMLAFFRWVNDHVMKLACLTAPSFPLGIILGLIVYSLFFMITPVCIVLFTLFMIVFGIMNIIGSYTSGKRIKRVKDQIIPYVQSKNSQFVGRGYHWVIPNQAPYWIELWHGENAVIEVVNMETQKRIPVGQESTYSALNHLSPNYSP